MSKRIRAFLVGLGLVLTLVLAILIIQGCIGKQAAPAPKPKPTTLILATTTSTQDTGLLDFLIPKFEKRYNIKVKTIAVGTGEALAMGQRGDADVLMVHSRKAEDQFVADGFGANRRDLMYNDFVIIGPESDPAGIKGSTDPSAAFKKITQSQATFVSRGDNSGTHKKEQSIWDKAGIKPSGSWYVSAGQGMGETARITNEKQGYTLIDRGTYLALKKSLKLVILVENAKDLLNPYGVIAVNPAKFPKVHYVEAMLFIGWITSPDVQKMIGEFGKDRYGQAMFVPLAVPQK
ncbi:MAG: substrate-binding domain-containing protein [Actinomycetota bacterium]